MNFEPMPPPNADNKRHEILTVGWIFTSLSIVVVTLKLWTRVRLLHLQGYDDALVVISVVR